MRKYSLLQVGLIGLGCMVGIFLAPFAQAASSNWSVDAAGSWCTAGSWLGNSIPGATSGTASTDIATFGSTLKANRTVTVDSNRNISGITYFQYVGL